MQSSEPGPPEVLGGRGTFIKKGYNRKRLIADRLARQGVTIGGWAIIASILAILFVIVAEFLPMFKDPTVELLGEIRSPTGSPILAAGLDEYQEIAYFVDKQGIHFASLKEYTPLPDLPVPELKGAEITGVSPSVRGFLLLGLSDSRALPVRINFRVDYSGDQRTIHPELIAEESLLVRSDGKPVKTLGHLKTKKGYFIAAVKNKGTVLVQEVRMKKTLMGTVRRKVSDYEVSLPVKGEISALALDEIRGGLIVGTTFGQIFRADYRDSSVKPQIVGASTRPDVGITFIRFLLGSYTLVVGDSEGKIGSYQFFKEEDGIHRLRKIYDFESHPFSAGLISTSLRDKGFITGGEGTLQVHYGTTGTTKLSLKKNQIGALNALSLAPKGDAILSGDRAGKLVHWRLENPYPEISWNGLFGDIWYEGYQEPEYVWQSTGGSDEFESKFSLSPLIFGTLKGTLYAMLFAVPLAILGAFYTSQFMHPKIKSYVKPTIEIMAALPSVVLGFFGALFIAPVVEKFLPGVVLMPFAIAAVVTAVVVVFLGCHRVARFIKPGREIFWLIPVTIIGFFLSFKVGQAVESAWLMGDHRTWLREVFHVTYDQRNALIVGLAMGFAIIPIIFTITEDAMSNVPDHLKASSLAMGATPWQTALQVILPTASPGLFSAVMIGFGRAAGETMIVLMATGNTPIMEWDIFNGFRAMSANIAVELPEAPEGGTLFRILFFSAFLLFCMTFLVNTFAELVRLRLRRRYRTL